MTVSKSNEHTSAVASAGPTPGIASSRLLVAFDRCQAMMRLSNSRILGLQCPQLTAESSKARACHFQEPPIGCISDDFQKLLDTPAPDGGDDPELGKIGADRIDHGSLLANEEKARTMKHQAALFSTVLVGTNRMLGLVT